MGRGVVIAGLAALGLMAAGAAPGWSQGLPPAVASSAKPVAAPRDFIPGYLPKGAWPSSLAVLPPAPAAGSATQARDEAEAKQARALKGSARWDLAAEDADLYFPAAADTYACALGIRVSQEGTPHLYTLLRRTLADAAIATGQAKHKYQRPRPFMTSAGGAICTPKDEDSLRKDGSYPSGHSAIGWTWALTLAAAAPDRQDPILARGRTFLQSRVVCNVHWLSDTEAGAMVGSAVFARLQDEAEFRTDLQAAKAEIETARAAGKAPTRDCAAEAAALASDPIDQP